MKERRSETVAEHDSWHAWDDAEYEHCQRRSRYLRQRRRLSTATGRRKTTAAERMFVCHSLFYMHQRGSLAHTALGHTWLLRHSIRWACRPLVPNYRARGARGRRLERRSLTPVTIC